MRPVQTPTVDNPSPSFGAQVARTLVAEASEDIVNLFHDRKQSSEQQDKRDAQNHEI
jgi:hypothetical protein